MKRWTRFVALALGLVFVGSAAMGDFYVIPVRKNRSAPVARTGQEQCFQTVNPYGTCECGTLSCPSGQDGDLQKGVAWPNPRFTDNGNGTISDNLTGLVWTKNANCVGMVVWATALAHCHALASGPCGLSDGSVAGDWRLPNRRELESLIDFRYYEPAVSNRAGTGKAAAGDPFTSLMWDAYWSSTTYAHYGYTAWYIDLGDGYAAYDFKADSFFRALCVR